MGSDSSAHDFKGRAYRCCLYAHGLGATGVDLCHLLPPLLVLVFVAIMVSESNYTLLTRVAFFGWHS